MKALLNLFQNNEIENLKKQNFFLQADLLKKQARLDLLKKQEVLGFWSTDSLNLQLEFNQIWGL